MSDACDKVLNWGPPVSGNPKPPDWDQTITLALQELIRQVQEQLMCVHETRSHHPPAP